MDEVTPGRFKLYAEFLSGEQVLVVDVEPELDPKGVSKALPLLAQRRVANLKTSLICDFYPSQDLDRSLNCPGGARPT